MLQETEKLFPKDAKLKKIKYNSKIIFSGIQGHHLPETDFKRITREHPSALERVFEDVGDCFLLKRVVSHENNRIFS